MQVEDTIVSLLLLSEMCVHAWLLLRSLKPSQIYLRFVVEGDFAANIVRIKNFSGRFDDFPVTGLTQVWDIGRGKQPAEESFPIQDLVDSESPELNLARSKESSEFPPRPI